METLDLLTNTTEHVHIEQNFTKTIVLICEKLSLQNSLMVFFFGLSRVI